MDVEGQFESDDNKYKKDRQKRGRSLIGIVFAYRQHILLLGFLVISILFVFRRHVFRGYYDVYREKYQRLVMDIAREKLLK
jgi:hypothetical protein